jgi:hypothetical protein
MRVLRLVALGGLLGAAAGFVVALLRSRPPSTDLRYLGPAPAPDPSDEW